MFQDDVLGVIIIHLQNDGELLWRSPVFRAVE